MQPHSYNTDTERVDSQRVKSVTTMGWVNYKKPGYSWGKISNLILPDGTVTKQNLNVQLPGSSQGWTDILFDSQFSIIRKRIDGRRENNEPALELSVCVEAQHNVTGTIDPNNPEVMLYSDAWDGADLRMGTSSGMRPCLNKIIEIKEMPAGDGDYIEYSFLMRSNKAKAMVESARPWNGNAGEHFSLIGQEAFIARGDSQIRGCFLGIPKCWWHTTDEDGDEIVETRDIELHCTILSDGETVRATKKIPRAYIQQAISDGSHLFTDETFHTDYNAEGRDFWSQKSQSGYSYNNMMGEALGNGGKDSSGSTSKSPPTNSLAYGEKAPRFRTSSSLYGQVTIKGYYFDTTDLAGVVDTTSTSTVEIPIHSHSAVGGYVNIFSSDDRPQWGEYDGVLSVAAAADSNLLKDLYRSINGQPALSTAKAVSSLTVDGTFAANSYNTFTLNSAGESNINKNGYTKIWMTFSNWDSRVGGSDPGFGGTQKRYIYCYHSDDSRAVAEKQNVGAKLTTVFKQITNPGGFWFMG